MQSFDVRSLLVLPLLAGAAAAQGVFPLSQTMRFGAIGADFTSACGPGQTPTAVVGEGTITFQPNGAFAIQASEYSVCPGGTTIQGPVETGSGTCEVGTDGVLRLEWLPTLPGADPDAIFLRADGSVAVRSRKNDRSDDSVAMIAVALSAGKDASSLAGTWHILRLGERNDASGFSMIASVGTATFDGFGSFTEQGSRHELAMGGTVTVSSYGPSTGSYTVASDGTLSTASGTIGALSPDDDVCFWTRRGTMASLTIGLRTSSAAGAVTVAGAWRFAAMTNAIAATSLPGELNTDWGLLSLVPTGTGAGTLALDLLHVSSSPGQTLASQVLTTDTFTITPQGAITLGAVAPGATTPDGSVFAAITSPGEGLGLALGLSACGWPSPVGAGTSGTGGRAPLILPMGGFPYLGNGAFGLVVANGRGGAPAGLAMAGAVSGGQPLLGGTLWLDPNQLVGSLLLQLSGPPGAAGTGAVVVPLPLPLAPALAGVHFAGQAFCLDPAAPQGVAMSAALEFELCR